MALQQLIRKFKLGALVLDDPSPESNVQEVQRILARQYPQVRHTTIWEQDGEVTELNGVMTVLHTFVLPPLSING